MKKITLCVAVLTAFTFASCKKDRVCTCTTASSSGNSIDKTTYYKVKKKDAQLYCIGSQSEYTDSSGNVFTDDKTTCELK
jgi:outer membrane protein assembly factor BamE (lipoprotein component of BamABCDE complex)